MIDLSLETIKEITGKIVSKLPTSKESLDLCGLCNKSFNSEYHASDECLTGETE